MDSCNPPVLEIFYPELFKSPTVPWSYNAISCLQRRRWYPLYFLVGENTTDVIAIIRKLKGDGFKGNLPPTLRGMYEKMKEKYKWPHLLFHYPGVPPYRDTGIHAPRSASSTTRQVFEILRLDEQYLDIPPKTKEIIFEIWREWTNQ